jgi:uncharacterized ion transporter superfamily protein YfcC
MSSPTPATRAPDALLIITAVLLIAVVMTWVIPAGEFERRQVGSRTVVVPGTYRTVEAEPVAWHGFLTAPVKGFADRDAAMIVAFVLLIGGSFALINATGAISALLYWLVKVSGNDPRRRRWVIPVLMTAFSIAGGTIGMSEEVLVFILITLPLARRMGWDAIVGAAIPFIGAGVGFAGAAFNPFTIGIAQGLAELPLFSGWEFRLALWAALTVIAIAFVMCYAARIERDPSASLLAGSAPAPVENGGATAEEMNFRRGGVIALLGFGLVLLLVGVTRWDWYIAEISALFLALGLGAALLGGLGFNPSAQAFTQGARDMIGTVLIIALSRSVLIVLQEGRVIDTVLHTLSSSISDLPPMVSAQGMLAVQFALNALVPSGSGQAALTMPVMAPLADLLHLPRQAAVLAFQLGDGLCNFIIPTSAITMGVLGIARIPYVVWLRWIAWLMVWLVGCGAAFLAVGATLIRW